jgi:hypothetical protein
MDCPVVASVGNAAADPPEKPVRERWIVQRTSLAFLWINHSRDPSGALKRSHAEVLPRLPAPLPADPYGLADKGDPGVVSVVPSLHAGITHPAAQRAVMSV